MLHESPRSINVPTTRRLPPQLQGYDDVVLATMREWSVPGVAIAVVRDGEILLSDGFGWRDIAGGHSVAPTTLFPIGACTMAFTSLALGMLADEGKLDWDAPVRRYLPAFTLYDTIATEHTTARDLVTHRTGLPRHRLMCQGTTFTRDEVFARLRYLQPSKDFRALWQYENLMYLVAGSLLEQLTGASWEDLIRQRIFDPLGMTNSYCSLGELQGAAEVALPYLLVAGELTPVSLHDVSEIAPATGINTSVADMCAWLFLQLGQGRFQGVSLVSEAQLAQMHAPQMIIADPSRHPEMSPAAYGLGWVIQSYRGHTVIHHGGGSAGFTSLVSLLPQHNTGVVVLTNSSANPVPEILVLHLYDRLLGLEQISWSDRYRTDYQVAREAAARGKTKSDADRVAATRPSHPLAAYTGDFVHPAYGRTTVVLQDDRLELTLNTMRFTLDHYHYDVFEATSAAAPHERLTAAFTSNVRGDIDRLAMPLEPSVADIVFSRLPDPQLSDPVFLAQFVGAYELLGVSMTITLHGERTLLMAIPGQPGYELLPYRGKEFMLSGTSGFSVEFQIDAASQVHAALVSQPNGVFIAKRC